ncbi:uncharacterized protein LOC130677993 [Microplitis mediator]|uniref:uncharacterized protein LOC130677993 n=1 Tax=Microplitis mediator TaxID=375433 RepID=UPI0025536BF4|nr:uncharacterized protein LOC130677993 [Microplitis mediator]
MKIFAVILAVCFVGALAELNEEEKAKLHEYRTACLTEIGSYEDQVSNAPDGNWIVYGLQLQCFSSCMLMKIKAMNEDGTLNEEIIRKRMANDVPADKIDAVIMKCKDLKGANICETGMMIMRCCTNEKIFTQITEKSN